MVDNLSYIDTEKYRYCLIKNGIPVAVFKTVIDAKIEKRRMQETELINSLPRSRWEIASISSEEQHQDVTTSRAQREELRKSRDEEEIRKSIAQLKGRKKKARTKIATNRK